MGRRHSLRIRLALAFAGLGALLSLLFAIGIWFAAQDVSRRLIDETLDAEMADYMARRARNPQSLPPDTASLTGHLLRSGENDQALPAGIAGLPPGRYDLIIEAIPFRVEIAERDGERYVLLFNETRQKRREQRFLVYLAAGAGLITLLVAAGGLWLAGLVIAPLSELAAAVSRADPQTPPNLTRAGGPGDEIDELAQAFDRYLARLAAFIEREQAFAADASHELRTPLATIRGAAEVLEDDPGLNAGQRTRLARITRSCDEMGELIAALLLLSREEDQPAEILCDIGQTLRQCEERYRDLATSRHTRIALHLAGEVLLPVQPAFVTMIVANLMHNAVAHTRNGSITVWLDQRQMIVADTGSGIPAAELGQVFERHFRGAESRGAGIGLSLVKRICERLGWRISLASHPVTGTTATLDFAS
jgi:signal transduction histidine kinase